MKIGPLVGKPEENFIYEASHEWILPSQKIGIEIEVENAVPPFSSRLSSYWENHQDESLRNNGQEFTTVGGLFGKDLLAALNAFDRYRNKAWQVNNRTGLHIHMDVTNMDTFPDLAAMCVIYSLLEKLIFAWVGNSRERNINCLPWYKAQNNLKEIGSLISKKKQNSGEFRRISRDLHRYSAMNLASIPKYGTVEFRHMRGTFDIQKIKTWINLIMCLKHSAMSFKFNDLQQLVERAERFPDSFVYEVFGRMKAEFQDCGLPENQIQDCLSTGYDLSILYQQEEEKENISMEWDAAPITLNPEFEESPLIRYVRRHGQNGS